MRGTRFRVFPKPEEDWLEPETVEMSLPPGTIGPGPRDAKMHALLPLAKTIPYDPPSLLPPYKGPCRTPALPDAAGHFDHIAVDDPAFLPAHMYACVRRTLDAWELYLGRPVRWWHADVRPELELIAHVDWNNAQSGLGFIEAGGKRNTDGKMRLFALNFDVIAHETGHAILFSEMGAPAEGLPSAAFLAFHESFSDLVSLIAVLHFPSVVTRLLAQTQGNLYALNMLNRIGELSHTEQIRVADNETTMADVAGITLSPQGEWIDLQGLDRNAHGLAQPLTGAIFDVLVEGFQDGLVARGAIPPLLDVRHWSRAEIEGAIERLHGGSGRSLAAAADDFRWALERARDVVGLAMQLVMRTLRPEEVSFGRVAGCFIESAAEHGQAHLVPDLVDIFRERGIEPVAGGHAAVTGPAWHRLPYAERARRVAATTPGRAQGCGCRAHGGFLLAGRLIREGHAVARQPAG